MDKMALVAIYEDLILGDYEICRYETVRSTEEMYVCKHLKEFSEMQILDGIEFGVEIRLVSVRPLS